MDKKAVMVTTQKFTMSNFRRRWAFTVAELMLVIIILVLLAGFSGAYYVGTYKKASLKSAARNLLLMGRYARLRAIEDGQACRLYLDNAHRQLYVVVPVFDAVSQTQKQTIVSNPYCRKMTLDNGIEFEYVDVTPAMGESETGGDSDGCINFYPDGSCDSAVVQMGNGRHSMTAVFSSAYARIKIYEGSMNIVEAGMQVVDLDTVD